MKDEKMIKIKVKTCFWSEIETFILEAIKNENISMFLIRERSNTYDKNAIAICIDYQKAVEICKKNNDLDCLSLVNQPITKNGKWLRIGYVSIKQDNVKHLLKSYEYEFDVSGFLQEYLDYEQYSDLIQIFLDNDYCFTFNKNYMYVEVIYIVLRSLLNEAVKRKTFYAGKNKIH